VTKEESEEGEGEGRTFGRRKSGRETRKSSVVDLYAARKFQSVEFRTENRAGMTEEKQKTYSGPLLVEKRMGKGERKK
jgi:hypothetical protein